MATGTSPPPLPPGYQNDTARYGDFVDEHLAKVRNGIRVSDFFAKAMGLGAVILIYLLGLIIIDHWVTDLGTYGRVLGLAGLILGSGYYIVRYLLPDLMRKINPAYAAQMVEQTEPSLRNSLINFVLLRPKRESVREVIYHQVEQQAATRLSRVDVADAVDQTPLIRLALCLLGALILFAAYTIFSPKSPFQSIGRILSPFSEVSRPARVRISDIQPRNTTVFAGDAVEVSAIVDVDDDSEPVWLIYSTTDGQKVDVKRPMLRDAISMRHVATPTDDGTISQTIDYRIVAGDAEEGPFRITVSQAPTIFVEEIVLDYPKYTELPAETLDSQADIRALEGTRVTVRGRTNQDIDSAIIELDPGAKKPMRLKMTSDGRTAEGSFLIKLREDRQTPLNESYRLAFTSVDGKVSQNAVEHTIEVLPDLPPQIEILTPAQLEIELPQNAQQTIEVRGLDPDYGLVEMRVQAVVGRKLIVNHSLLSDPGLGQRVGKFVFRPRQYGLQPGDEVVFIGLAKDNRTDAQTGSPMPNVSATQRYKIRITEPRQVPPNEDEGLQQDDGRNDQPAPGDEGGADGEEGEGDGENGEGDEGENGEGGAGANGEGQDGEDGENEGAEGEGQEGAGGKSQGEAGEGEDGEGQQGAGTEEGEGDRKGNAADGDQAEGGADGEGDADGSKREGEGGKLGGDGDPQAGHKEGGERGAGDPQQEGTPGGEATEGGNDPTTNAKGADPNGDDPAGKRPGEEGGDPGDVDESGEPLDSNGGDDGEAFERIVDHMKDKFGEAADGTPQPCPNGECANEGSEGGGSNNPGEGGDPNESEGEKGASDGDETGDKPGAEGDEPGEGEGEGETGENPSGENGDKEGEAAGEGDKGDKGAGEEAGDNPGAEGDKPGEGDEGKGEGEGDNGEGAEGENGNKPGGEKGDSGGPNGDQPGDQDGEGADGDKGEGQGEGDGDKGEGDKPGENGDPSSNGGGKPGGENAEGEDAGEGPDDQADANQQPGDKQGGDASNSTSGGADSQQGAQSPNAPGGEGEWFDDEELPEPGGDDPNLEYARKATNLALDYLKHNKDEQLQEDLGWTDKQMQDFVKRWQQMQGGAAPSDSADPDRELNDALRSLGMRRGSDRIRASSSKNDKARVRDSGTRSQPPAEYVDQYRAYLKSLGKRPRN